MKFSATITVNDASASELAKMFTALSGSTANITVNQHIDTPAAEPVNHMPSPTPQYQSPPTTAPVPPMPSNPGNDDEGDENAPVNTAAPAVDSTGLPWDERIHAATKALTDKGVWRKRRGVADHTVTAVEAELRARGAPQQPTPQFPMPTTVQQMPAPANLENVPQTAPLPVMPQMQPYQPPATPVPEQPQYQQQPQMPTMQQPSPQPAAAPASGPMDFHTFMQTLSAQMQKRDGAGQPLITADYLAKITAEIAAAVGTPLTAITDIAANPNAINYAVQFMQRDGRWN